MVVVVALAQKHIKVGLSYECLVVLISEMRASKILVVLSEDPALWEVYSPCGEQRLEVI